MNPLIQFDKVSYTYANAGKEIQILNNASLDFYEGKVYTILGPSGSGKTTMLALAAGMDIPCKGKILYCGEDILKIGLSEYRKKYVSLVFQNYNLINYFTALENVLIAMPISTSHYKERKKTALDILLKLGLSEDEANRNVLRLSGSQQQRVAIARAMARNTKVIFADEPTGNLDKDTAQEITTLFLNLSHEMNKCVVIVTHSHEIAEKSDETYKLDKKSFVRIA